jgi:rhomboid protease GluP
MDERPFEPPISVLDPRIFATATLIVIQFSTLCAIGLAGGGFLIVQPAELERYGALVRPLVWSEHQYWRLATAMFLHGGPVHFFLNAFCLYYFGGQVEIGLGRIRYLLLYVAAGLTGNLASLLWGRAFGISVGASGAIFGIVVAYLIMQMRGPVHWTRVLRQPTLRLLFFLIGIQLAMGFLRTQIDSMAHLGGAATGVTLGLFLVSLGGTGWKPFRRGRWMGLGAWVIAAAALAILAFRSPGVVRQVQMAFYYLETNRAKAIRYFASATAADPSGAIAELDRLAWRLAPPMDRAYMAAALVEAFDADVAAVEHYRTLASRHPSPSLLWLIATLLQKPALADYQGAQAACSQGKNRFGGKQEWDLLEAQIHASFRQFDRALTVLHRIETTTQSKLADYWEIAALCHLRRRQWAEAENATSRCLAQPWLHLGNLESKARLPMDLPVQDWRYRTLSELGRTGEADALGAEMEKRWRDAVTRSPDDPTAINNLAWFLATHGGDLDEALLLSKQSVAMSAESYNLDTLAWVEHLRGDQKAAWGAMEQALAAGRSVSPEYEYHAGAILAALGNQADARKYLERAVAPGVDFDDFDTAEQLLKKLGQ